MSTAIRGGHQREHAMADAGERQPGQKWYTFSLAGILLILFILSLGVALWLPLHSGEHLSSSVLECQSNLKHMYNAMRVYVSMYGQNKHYMPHTGDSFWTCLLGHPSPDHGAEYERHAPSHWYPHFYMCPGSVYDERSVFAGGPMADYRGPKRHPKVPPDNPSALVDGIPPKTIICCEAPAHHGKEGGNVLYFDGTIEFLAGDAFQAALEQTE